MSRSVALLCCGALALIGCYAAPPPSAVPTDLSGCHPGAYAAPSALACARDSDCVLCRTADEACGELALRSELLMSNAPCPPIDPAACHGAGAACCGGRCVSSLGPPPL